MADGVLGGAGSESRTGPGRGVYCLYARIVIVSFSFSIEQVGILTTGSRIDGRAFTFHQRPGTKYLRSRTKRKCKPSASVPNPQPLPPFPPKSNPRALSASVSLADQIPTPLPDTNPRILHSLQDENLALDTMTRRWFELVANDRPVELRANIFATIGVGVALAKVAVCANFCVDFEQTVEADRAWS